jgi:hypothetical protein
MSKLWGPLGIVIVILAAFGADRLLFAGPEHILVGGLMLASALVLTAALIALRVREVKEP